MGYTNLRPKVEKVKLIKGLIILYEQSNLFYLKCLEMDKLLNEETDKSFDKEKRREIRKLQQEINIAKKEYKELSSLSLTYKERMGKERAILSRKDKEEAINDFKEKWEDKPK